MPRNFPPYLGEVHYTSCNCVVAYEEVTSQQYSRFTAVLVDLIKPALIFIIVILIFISPNFECENL